VFGLNFYLASHRVSPETQVAVVACAYVITQLVVVPLVLRNFAPRALLIQGGSVLAASAAAFASFYLIVA
jgi:hypothetical protein